MSVTRYFGDYDRWMLSTVRKPLPGTGTGKWVVSPHWNSEKGFNNKYFNTGAEAWIYLFGKYDG